MNEHERTQVELAKPGDFEEERLWSKVLENGDPEALRRLAETIADLDERELGEGD